MLAVSREASTTSLQATWPTKLEGHVATSTNLSASLFTRQRFRPIEHFQTEHSWMNDTIGPIFNPETGFYHLYCQWNPKGTQWGNMSWYSAVSKDLITWSAYGPQPALSPDQPYDHEGVFTGLVLPHGLQREQAMMTAIYTSVISPTIHHTLPYEDGSETVSIAVSTDAGLTWQKEVTNPILKGPPSGEKVTGFRDPSVAPMPSIDRLLGRAAGQYVYGTLSGGFANRTPTAFLYSIPANNMRQWNYLGSLIEDYKPDSKWCGEGGRNFECCSLFELEHEPTLLTSTEGGNRRWSIWIQGQMALEKGSPKLQSKRSGVLDWGCFYAASSSEHPLDKRRLLMGWIPEDGLTVEQCASQGWAGMASLPRELAPLRYEHVVKSLASNLSELASFTCQKEDNGTFTLSTLGIRPVKELLKLREGARGRHIAASLLHSSNKSLRLPLQSRTWELEFDAHITPACAVLNILLQHSSTECTLISFDTLEERFTIERQRSSLIPGVKRTMESGSHTLLSMRDEKTGSISQEALRIRLFFDVSVIELYANDRFAMSTRVYPGGSGGASVFIAAETQEGTEGSSTALAKLLNVGLWER